MNCNNEYDSHHGQLLQKMNDLADMGDGKFGDVCTVRHHLELAPTDARPILITTYRACPKERETDR